jgi:hypothetical protein
VIEAQPYGSHLLHQALAAAGRHGQLLDHIRSRWGPMLDSGSTFWETWEAAGWDSRCHGYSSTPAFELSSEILGVSPISPGFARFRVAPHPAGLEWAEGAFPTPRGPIGISWKAPRDVGFEMAVDVPEGCQAQVLFPEADRRQAGAFSIDGSPAPNGGDLPALGPGKHRLLALR